ncbi:MAG: hypothetical protein ABIQ74_12475 [Chitinophagales bacterium]
MKISLFKPIFPVVVILSVLSSCQHDVKDQLVGTWQMARVKLTSTEEQQKMIEGRIGSLKDSLTNASDTARQNKFQNQITIMNKRLSDMILKQDSAIKKTTWEFKSNGDFIAYMGTQQNKGLWSFDQDMMMLFTIIAKQTYSQRAQLEKDSLTLQLDSVNYFKFARIK